MTAYPLIKITCEPRRLIHLQKEAKYLGPAPDHFPQASTEGAREEAEESLGISMTMGGSRTHLQAQMPLTQITTQGILSERRLLKRGIERKGISLEGKL
jgi:hypothetical protein